MQLFSSAVVGAEGMLLTVEEASPARVRVGTVRGAALGLQWFWSGSYLHASAGGLKLQVTVDPRSVIKCSLPHPRIRNTVLFKKTLIVYTVF